MADWLDEYARTTDRNERYRLLRAEMARLRGEAGDKDLYDREAVAATIRRLNDAVDGDLVVFVANDFGLPRAYRPAETGLELQAAVHRALLDGKYATDPELDDLRQRLLADHPGIHKAIVAVVDGATLRYHLPEGSTETTNFLTVREMLGLIDYTTNAFQGEGRSLTY